MREQRKLACLLVYLFLQACISQIKDADSSNSHLRLCSGTLNGYSQSGLRTSQYGYLKSIYENCTVIYNNLEITHYTERKELDFLDTIEEVKGSVLIYANGFSSLRLQNLKLIWGQKNKVQGTSENALEILHNDNLQFLEMPNLRGIMSGNALVTNNELYCFADKIAWFELFNSPDQRAIFSDNNICPSYVKCGKECETGCFSDATYGCQIAVRSKCSPSCKANANSCYYNNATSEYDCCDPQCGAGCYGPTAKDCYACKHFRDEATKRCVEHCAPMFQLDPLNKTRVKNPDGTYTHDRSCVKECPVSTLIEGEFCVLRCSPGYFHDARLGTRTCVPCEGECPKSCMIEEPITRANIGNLVNCTEIDGFIRILGHTFKTSLGCEEASCKGLNYVDLTVLKTVRQVTQFVDITDTPLKTLDFLENLEIVEGRVLSDQKFAILASANYVIKSVGWRSLTKVQRGDVVFSQNFYLCYVSNETFTGLLAPKNVARIGPHSTVCVKENRVCDENCVPEYGCWGAGPMNCRKCKEYKMDGRCVGGCDKPGYRKTTINGEKICERCAEQCLTCNGPTENDCLSCRNARIMINGKLYCRGDCPISHFRKDNLCIECHKNCVEEGCTGPSDEVREGGCKNCSSSVELEDIFGHPKYRCLSMDRENYEVDVCQQNNLTAYYPYVNGFQTICRECADECSSCKTGGVTERSGCICKHKQMQSLSASNGYECLSDCGTIGFPLNDSLCGRCDSRCEGGCTGPSNLDCHKCINATIYTAEGQMKCLQICDDEHPEYDASTKICLTKGEVIAQVLVKALCVAIVIVVVVVIGVIFRLCFHYKYKLGEEKARQKLEEIEVLPIDPSAKPNMSHFNVIQTDELTVMKKKVLGQGEFGIVYAGVYKKYNYEFPVAIKAIKNGNMSVEKEQKDMLDEATKMAALTHSNLTKLLGICFADKTIQLVTWLRPLGSLLNYLKIHKNKLGSRKLLNYCHQIASAMMYLHENKIVHRDLAARNVLMKNEHHVEVTDFGLARFMDLENSDVVAKGEKIAFKWSAPESFGSHTYTSDIWSFGVTVWEIITYGKTPYENMDAYTILNFIIVKGLRLEQPEICSINVYAILLKCWAIIPEVRPTFEELEKKFRMFCKNPSIYLLESTPESSNSIQLESETQMLQNIFGKSDLQNPLDYDEYDVGPISAGTRLTRFTSSQSQWSDLLGTEIQPSSPGPSAMYFNDTAFEDPYVRPDVHTYANNEPARFFQGSDASSSDSYQNLPTFDQSKGYQNYREISTNSILKPNRA